MGPNIILVGRIDKHHGLFCLIVQPYSTLCQGDQLIMSAFSKYSYYEIPYYKGISLLGSYLKIGNQNCPVATEPCTAFLKFKDLTSRMIWRLINTMCESILE